MEKFLSRLRLPWFSKPKSPSNEFYGGKRAFKADTMQEIGPKETIGMYGKQLAKGDDGQAYDLLVFRGKHRIQLVIKKYLGKADQSRIAQREFAAFQKLKAGGYSVLPTIRLVEINGTKFVALTDLSKFGDVQLKRAVLPSIWARDFSYIRSIGISEKEIKKMLTQITEENKRAEMEFGISLSDSWEIIIDTKNKTIKAFILDLSRAVYAKGI
ncbi:MAG: hypothetical protein PHH08_04990 [Candidatus ainarchaeum sp.]|nr:hypothetical protein [Candidatus ainarchaeum sp.]